MLKWIGRVFILGILAVVIVSGFAYFYLKATSPPAVDKARYGVQLFYEDGGQKIPTRYYYANEIEIVGGEAILKGYWSYNGEKYYYHRDEKVVEPPFKIIRR